MTKNNAQITVDACFDLMDQQHTELLDLLDEMSTLIDSDATQEGLILLCERLVNNLRQHFDDEERFMLKHFYPDTEAHIGLHMHYLSIVGKLIQCVKNHDCNNVCNILDYMKRWKFDHINEADKKYTDYIRDKSA